MPIPLWPGSSGTWKHAFSDVSTSTIAIIPTCSAGWASYTKPMGIPKAVDYYSRFVDLWEDADAERQPIVEDVRGRLARLVGEGGVSREE